MRPPGGKGLGIRCAHLECSAFDRDEFETAGATEVQLFDGHLDSSFVRRLSRCIDRYDATDVTPQTVVPARMLAATIQRRFRQIDVADVVVRQPRVTLIRAGRCSDRVLPGRFAREAKARKLGKRTRRIRSKKRPQLADIAGRARRLPELEFREARGIASEYVGLVIGHGKRASVSATVEVKQQDGFTGQVDSSPTCRPPRPRQAGRLEDPRLPMRREARLFVCASKASR